MKFSEYIDQRGILLPEFSRRVGVKYCTVRNVYLGHNCMMDSALLILKGCEEKVTLEDLVKNIDPTVAGRRRGS